MPKFDLDKELEFDPPTRQPKQSIMDNPRVNEWLRKLLSLRANGERVSFEYIASKLTQGCHVEKILPGDRSIAPSTVRLYVRTKFNV